MTAAEQTKPEGPLYFEYEGNLVSTDGSGEIVGIVLPDGSHELYPVRSEPYGAEALADLPSGTLVAVVWKGGNKGEYLVDQKNGLVLPNGENYIVVGQFDEVESFEVVEAKPSFTPWEPKTETDLLWIMERRANLVSKVKRLEAQEKEILARIAAQKSRANKDVENLDRRFKVDIFRLARAFVPKGKKTWSSPFGSVAFTSFSA